MLNLRVNRVMNPQRYTMSKCRGGGMTLKIRGMDHKVKKKFHAEDYSKTKSVKNFESGA